MQTIKLEIENSKVDVVLNIIQNLKENIITRYEIVNDQKESKDFHDRFLILDSSEIYHIGASLKDLGNKVFAFNKMDISSFELLGKLK